MLEFGLTQRELAERIGVTQSQVSSWISGRSEMPQSTAMAIGLALGIRWQWLLTSEGEMLRGEVTAHFPDDLKELAEIWPRLSHDDRQYILGVAEGRLAKSIR